MLGIVDALLVFHPRRNGEVLEQTVVQLGARHFDGRRGAVESEDLVLLLPVVRRQFVRPFSHRRRRQQVHAAGGRA